MATLSKIEDLPVETITTILEHLSLRDKLQLCSASRVFSNFIGEKITGYTFIGARTSYLTFGLEIGRRLSAEVGRTIRCNEMALTKTALVHCTAKSSSTLEILLNLPILETLTIVYTGDVRHLFGTMAPFLSKSNLKRLNIVVSRQQANKEYGLRAQKRDWQPKKYYVQTRKLLLVSMTAPFYKRPLDLFKSMMSSTFELNLGSFSTARGEVRIMNRKSKQLQAILLSSFSCLRYSATELEQKRKTSSILLSGGSNKEYIVIEPTFD